MGSSTSMYRIAIEIEIEILSRFGERERARKTSQYGDNLIPREIRNAELKKSDSLSIPVPALPLSLSLSLSLSKVMYVALWVFEVLSLE
jgi:hypothetical protein